MSSDLKGMLALQLEAHMRNRLAPAVDSSSLIKSANDEQFDVSDPADMATWLGQQPASSASLNSCVECVFNTLEAHLFAGGTTGE